MISFFYGTDGYRADRACRDLIREQTAGGQITRFVSKNIEQLDDLDKIEEALKSDSLLGGRVLIFIRHALASTTISTRLADILTEYDAVKRTDVLVAVAWEGKIEQTKHRAFLKVVAGKEVQKKEFPAPAGAGLARWIAEECTTRNRVVEPAAMRRLLELIGQDTWALAQEIEKLANYSDDAITVNDVEAIVADRRDIGPFELMDAAGTHNVPRALRLLATETERGRDPYNILAAFTSQFRSFVSVADASEQGMTPAAIARDSNMHPFVVRKALAAKQIFGLPALKAAFLHVAGLDRTIKDGRKNILDELYGFILRFV